MATRALNPEEVEQCQRLLQDSTMFHYLSPGRCVCTRGATARKRVLIAWVGGCLQPAECGQADARASLPGGAWSSAAAAAPCGRPPSATCRLLSAACRLPSAGCRLSARPRDRAPDAAAWAQGDVLQAEGEPCEHMFCVADGEVRRFRKEGQSTVEVRRIADQHAVAHLPARPHADGHAGSGRHDVYVRHPALGAERALLRDGARNDRRQGVHSEQR